MSKKRIREKMRIGTPPRYVLLRMKPETFYRLHEAASRNHRSLNFEANTIIQSALNEKGVPISA